MKTIDSDNDTNTSLNSCSNGVEEVTDLLIDSKRGHSLIRCNPDLVQSYDVLKGTSMGLKDHYYQRVLLKNNVTQDSRSQSLPNSLDENEKTSGNVDIPDSCDTKLLADHDSPPNSPNSDVWFKTWPEKRCDKLKTDSTPESTSPKKCLKTNISNGSSPNAKLTLNDALQNISLAYSPVTKQLHLVEKQNIHCLEENISELKKLGHRRNEPGSFSSTISSLSDPSPSGSLLDPEDRSSPICEQFSIKSKRKGISNFFNRQENIMFYSLINNLLLQKRFFLENLAHTSSSNRSMEIIHSNTY